MPRLLKADSTDAEKDDKCGSSIYFLRVKGETGANSILLLWERLLQSYLSFSQAGAPSFVINSTEEFQRDPPRYFEFGVKNHVWSSEYNTKNGVKELIFHFYLANDMFDTFSWIIAFCLIDRLQLMYYVQQTLAKTGFCEPSDRKKDTFRLSTDYLIHILFIVYSLALKWHLDFSVSLNYMAHLLPFSYFHRRKILSASVQFERYILRLLEYNCYVSESQVTQLLDHFLTASEQKCIFDDMHRVH
ncbi:unnamed protein product [Phytomonas sp. Hart1]|nr:unnamed protein product [Phytomonas sp. Hart1]|eukprot:CCW67257.1 unnamed protein product [Phytomonas sp. isolate Hart1]